MDTISMTMLIAVFTVSELAPTLAAVREPKPTIEI